MKLLSDPRVKPSDERYTPAWLLNLITGALGPIQYDPCTSPANPAGAVDFSALPESCLQTDWKMRARGGLVYVNSPFSTGNLRVWAKAIVAEASAGAEVVALTPVDPSTEWFTILSSEAALAIALKQRPAYGTPEGAYDSVAKQPAMLWYFGARARHFARVMAPHAHCWIPGLGG